MLGVCENIFKNKMQCLSRTMKTNHICFWKQQLFHTNPCLFDQPTLSEKPAWLKKFKLKQAAMQKNDGLPVYLKKGITDKILYRLTSLMVLGGVAWTFKVLYDTAKKN